MTPRDKRKAVVLTLVGIVAGVMLEWALGMTWPSLLVGMVIGAAPGVAYAGVVRWSALRAGSVSVDGLEIPLRAIRRVVWDQGALVLELRDGPEHVVRDRDESFWRQLSALPGFKRRDAGGHGSVLWEAR